jgi:SAM-dependent methyltransferase
LVARPARLADFDAYARTYRETVQRSIAFSGQDHETFIEKKALDLIDLAARRLGDPANLSVVDVGCGLGLAHRYLVGRFGELRGVDTAEEAVLQAAELNPSVAYQAYEGERLPFDDERFDLAFAMCVAHHVRRTERPSFAAELRRVVRWGGIVALFEHNPFNPLTRIAVNRCEFDEDVVLLTRREAARLLERAGLRRLEARYIVFFPSQRSRVAAIERRLAWLPAGAQYYVAAAR